MKLWLLMSRFGSGGLERVQVNLAPTFLTENMSPWLVAGRFLPVAGALLPPDVPTLELARKGRRGFLLGLFSQLRSHRPRVVMTTANDVACLVLALRALFFPRMKVICTQHLSISGPMASARGVERIKLRVIRYFMSKLLPRADAIIAVSHAVAEDMRATLRLSSEVSVIHNPVVLPSFADRAAERVDWPWPERSQPTIIFVGRLSPEKRLDLLLEAFELTIKRVPARLLVLGEGSERVRLQRAVSESGLTEVVCLAGFQANPLPWIKASDLLVLPSDYEGFGMVLVEAMACETQVISTDCPVGPAEILENGRYGRLVPPDSAHDLADAMISVLNGDCVPAEDLLRRANEFSLEAASIAYRSVIRRVLESAAGALT